jgi:hypothetical protein
MSDNGDDDNGVLSVLWYLPGGPWSGVVVLFVLIIYLLVN